MNDETFDDLLSSQTRESLILFIESQCSIDEVLSVFDMTEKQIETKFKIKDFESFYNLKLKSGQAKLKAKQFSKAMSGNAELLKFLGRDTKPVGDASLSVIELPNNNRIKS
jgi:hypothetical protein